MARFPLAVLAVFIVQSVAICADEAPLHRRIDALIKARAKGPLSPTADDAEFVRRIYLDFAGRIPSTSEARRFLTDKSPNKRQKLIDQLLNGTEYPVRMQELFNVMLMERLGDHDAWKAYLRKSFKKNKPWNQIAREILLASSKDESTRGAALFMSKRLENYGQNPVDYPGLTRDIGRLFLGKDLQCAQCHDHLFIDDYEQRDFQGLFAFIKNVSRARSSDPSVTEKPTTMKIEFTSVFGGRQRTTGPRVPGLEEVAIPKFKKGEEYRVKPDRRKRKPGVLKFSTLAKLADELPKPENDAFNRNIANRLWFFLMGRGLVHPLDLHHSDNPPSHPKLLDLLAKEMVAHQYDIKWMLRELALTKTYQRSSLLPQGTKNVTTESFRTAVERRLTAEQVLRSMLVATGEVDVKNGDSFDKFLRTFLAAFADPPREPVEQVNPSLKASLFLLNGNWVGRWLKPKPGNLIDRLTKIDKHDKLADELYLSVLSRFPTADEKQQVADYLSKRKDSRTDALRNLAWALLASTEFGVNH